MASLNIILTPVNVETRKSLDFRAGDTIRVFQKVREGEKVRLQIFEGLVLARKHGTEAGATFTVRKISAGIGVERVFPLYSPDIDRIEVKARASRHKRAKIYYVRDRAVREVRRKMKQIFEDLRVTQKETTFKQEEQTKTAE